MFSLLARLHLRVKISDVEGSDSDFISIFAVIFNNYEQLKEKGYMMKNSNKQDAINCKAVKNNPEKFPGDYMFTLNLEELQELRSKISSTKVSPKSRTMPKVITDIIMPDLETSETESTLELNFLIGKIKHTVKRTKKGELSKCG